MKNTDEKILKAKERILKAIEGCNRDSSKIFTGHSGGKDSTTIWHLTQSLMTQDVRVLHTPKDIESHLPNPTAMTKSTLEFIYNFTHIHQIDFVPRPKTSEYIKKHKLLCQIDGSRIEEFVRSDKSGGFIDNGVEKSRSELPVFLEKGLFGIKVVHPILDWTSNDVFNYHLLNNLPLSKEYLDDPEFKEYTEKNDISGFKFL